MAHASCSALSWSEHVANTRSGLGAERVEICISNHRDEQNRATSNQAPSTEVSSDQPLTTNEPSLAELTASVWQRLHEHPDITFTPQDGSTQDHRDDHAAELGSGSPSSSNNRPRTAYASEERIWRAVTGHGVDHKRIPPKLFEILEVVAAHGPEGVLQPKTRRITEQDKQSIPYRTDKLSDKGYITKERVVVPKMVTSRLKLWRWADPTTSGPKDTPRQENLSVSEHINYFQCFDGMMRVLQANDGVAALKDIQLDINCTTQPQRKALGRCLDKLEHCGLIRRIRAKVDSEDSDEPLIRCLQLLREPTDFDRESMIGRGGPVKVNKKPRSRKKSSTVKTKRKPKRALVESDFESDEEPDQDYGTDAETDDEAPNAYFDEPEEPLPEDISPLDGIDEPAAESSPILDESATEAPVPAPRTSQRTPKPSKWKPPAFTTPRRSNASKRVSSGSARQPPATAGQPQFASSLPRTPPTEGVSGVYFGASRVEKNRGSGRPKKNLVAVFKSDKLRPWLRGEIADAATPSLAQVPGPRPTGTDEAAPGPPQEMINGQDSTSPVAFPDAPSAEIPTLPVAPTAPAPVPATNQQPPEASQAEIEEPHVAGSSNVSDVRYREPSDTTRPPPAHRASTTDQQASLASQENTDDPNPTPSNGMLDAPAPVEPTTPPRTNKLGPASGPQSSAEKATGHLSKRSLGQLRRREKERAEKNGMMINASAASPSREEQALSNDAIVQRGRRKKAPAERNGGIVTTSPAISDKAEEGLSNHAIGQRKRRERERAQKDAAASLAGNADAINPSSREDVNSAVEVDESVTRSTLVAKLPIASEKLERFSKTLSRDIDIASGIAAEQASAAPVSAQQCPANEDGGEATPQIRENNANAAAVPSNGVEPTSQPATDGSEMASRPTTAKDAEAAVGSREDGLRPGAKDNGVSLDDETAGNSASGHHDNIETQSSVPDTVDPAPSLAQRDYSELPPLRFSTVEDDPPSPAENQTISGKHRKHVIQDLGHDHEERCEVVMEIVRSADGIFPGVTQMWYPFATKWRQTRFQLPESRTVDKVIGALRKEGKLKQYEFDTRSASGDALTLRMLLESDIDPASEQAISVQKRMLEALPEAYMPDTVEITDRLRRQGRLQSMNSLGKRGRDDEPIPEQAHKRPRISANDQDDPDYVESGNEDEENHEITTPRKKYDYTDNFPAAPDVIVKRTSAGIGSKDAAAQRNGFADAKTRAAAKTQLSQLDYKHLRRNALSTGNLITADDVHPSQPQRRRRRRGSDRPEVVTESPSQAGAPSIDLFAGVYPDAGSRSHVDEAPPIHADVHSTLAPTPKKRGGWPKGKPRKPKPSVSLVAPVAKIAELHSLLFFPLQISHAQTGTIGTFSNVPYHVTPQAGMSNLVGHVAKPVALPSQPNTASKKRSIDRISNDEYPLAMFMSSGQTVAGPSGTLGTMSMIPATSPKVDSGRGKRVKRSTEKALSFSKDAYMDKDAPAETTISSTTAANGVDYGKMRLPDDPDGGTVSTDYVNKHSNETWHHRGKGRWLRGLPPPGSSYKTAVKGPEAAAYLASIGTAERKPKKHGAVVNGQQLTKDGVPWKNQPPMLDGKRISPKEAKRIASQQAAAAIASQQAAAAAFAAQQGATAIAPNSAVDATTVQYEVPPSRSSQSYGSGSDTTYPGTPNKVPATPTPNPQQEPIANSGPSAASTAQKRKRAYTYKSRKQLSTFGPDGVPIELDRDSDDDYRQGSSPKKQRKQSQNQTSPAKSKHSIDRKKLSTAVALVRNLTGAICFSAIRWDLVGRALKMSDNGAAADLQYRSLAHYGPYANFVTAVEQETQEPFLAALEKGELPHVDHVVLENTDWPGLLEWAEKHVTPLIDDEAVENAKMRKNKLAEAREKRKPRQKAKEKTGRPISDTAAVFPATRHPDPVDSASGLDLNEDLIMVKSWIRANSATKDDNYDTAKATQQLTALGTPILKAVQEMQQTKTIRQLKQGRQRPGRNFEITQHVWNQFKKWPGEVESGVSYLGNLAKARAKIVGHFAENDMLELKNGSSEQDALILNGLVAQGMLSMEIKLPPRNDDIDAPGSKLNAWSYCGYSHDTRRVEKSQFDFPVVYIKTATFSVDHGLKSDVRVPTLPPSTQGEALPRVPFWIDVHGNLIPEIWEIVISSTLYYLVRRPGVSAKGIEKAHGNKLWAWEIEVALEWMEKVGVAERFGAGSVVEGGWKGGWIAGDGWEGVLGDEVAGWR